MNSLLIKPWEVTLKGSVNHPDQIRVTNFSWFWIWTDILQSQRGHKPQAPVKQRDCGSLCSLSCPSLLFTFPLLFHTLRSPFSPPLPTFWLYSLPSSLVSWFFFYGELVFCLKVDVSSSCSSSPLCPEPTISLGLHIERVKSVKFVHFWSGLRFKTLTLIP